ncbi:MAG: PAS domain-containing protein [Dehalococcoidia bacterium]
MAQPIEMILFRQLATSLALPVWLLDPEGELVFFNEAAERILGRRFHESNPLHIADMAETFHMILENGDPLPPEELVLAFRAAMVHPLHREMGFNGVDGRYHPIEVTAFPLVGHRGVAMGVVAMFWERVSS